MPVGLAGTEEQGGEQDSQLLGLCSISASYLHPLVGLSSSDDVVSLVLAERGANPADHLPVLFTVDAERVEVLFAVVTRHLPKGLHQMLHLLVDPQLLHLGEGFAGGARGSRFALRLFGGHTGQAGLAESVPALCCHGGLEELEADGAAEVLVHALHEALLGAGHGDDGETGTWQPRRTI